MRIVELIILLELKESNPDGWTINPRFTIEDIPTVISTWQVLEEERNQK